MRYKKCALDIGIKHEIKIVLTHIHQALGGADARVVNQNINRADLGLNVRHGGPDRVLIGHIELDHMGVAALGLNFRTQFLEPFKAAAGQHHGGASAGQGAGKLRPQATRGAGNQGHPARKVNAVCHGHFSVINRTIVLL